MLFVVWSDHESGLTFTQTIDVGQSPRWRTWVYHRMAPARVGHWRVEVRLSENFGGEVLTQLDFEVVPHTSNQPAQASSGPTS